MENKESVKKSNIKKEQILINRNELIRNNEGSNLFSVFIIAFLSMMLAIFSINLVVAQQEFQLSTSSCCEKTIEGAWCQNAPEEQCDTSNGLRTTPSSCETTSYCRVGYCYDSSEGTCIDKTPQRVCDENGGVWLEYDGSGNPPAQCSLGCCTLGDQAAFVTSVRCGKLSSLYGLETDFRTDIINEAACIASATSDVKGACVFEKNFVRTCEFTTKRDCQNRGAILSGDINKSKVEFHESFLCSAPELETNCYPTETTQCVEGKEEVYFKDSCGNLANIYDASRSDDETYWTKIISKPESCNPDSGNANSATCGNCDYFLGSTCKEYSRAKDARVPKLGDYICRDLSCKYEGQRYEHGETWCANSKGINENLPGSRYFRLVCYNGDVTVEPCADERKEVCLKGDVNGFSSAVCSANKWQNCYAQTTELDCLNTDKRDCQWLEGKELNGAPLGSFINQSQTQLPFRGTKTTPTTDEEIEEEEDKDNGACVPLDKPGFNFWESGQAEQLCSLASTTCIVKYEKRIAGEPVAVVNEECLTKAWAEEQNELCVAIGDCGSTTNFIGVKGYSQGYRTTVDDYEVEEDD